MAGHFQALDEILDDYLNLPVGDRVYRIESPSAEDGLRVERIMSLAVRMQGGGDAADAEVLDDDAEIDLYRTVLGATYDQLTADGVRWSVFRHIAMTAVFWVTADLATAEKYWASGGDPSRVAPNRATRRAGTRSSGSAAASKTPRRGSTSGTSTRKAAPRAAKT